MKTAQVIVLSLLLLGATARANADVIDFVAMANGATGESAWDMLTVELFGGTAKVNITGYDGGDRYAYLDRGWGGLGVCRALLGGATANVPTNSGANLCDPGNDDNVTETEYLSFMFNTDVTIDGIGVNNRHDGDTSMSGNTILIDGLSYTFTNGGPLQNSYNTTPYFVSAGTPFVLGYGGDNAETFYVSSISVRVPEPSTLLLLGTGLVALTVRRRRAA